MNDGDAARLQAVDCRGEQVPRGALHDVLGEHSEPAATFFPLTAGIVRELDVRRPFLEFY
jgi:hypothetical protein